MPPIESLPTARRDELRLLLRPAEAARALGICTRTLWSLTQRGELRSVRIGRAVAYSVDELRDFIQRRQQEGGGDEKQ